MHNNRWESNDLIFAYVISKRIQLIKSIVLTIKIGQFVEN